MNLKCVMSSILSQLYNKCSVHGTQTPAKTFVF